MKTIKPGKDPVFGKLFRVFHAIFRQYAPDHSSTGSNRIRSLGSVRIVV